MIGNPPYVQLQKMSEKANEFEAEGYETFSKMGDIYVLFYERGFKLLKQNGFLAYITSNKWMRAGYGEKLRSYFLSQTNPLWLIDFGGFQVFDATVDANILIAQKAPSENAIQTCVVGKDFSLNNISDYFNTHHTLSNFTGSGANSWVVMDNIEQRIKSKIEAVGTPLKDWDIQINYGIKTGFNEAFIISTRSVMNW